MKDGERKLKFWMTWHEHTFLSLFVFPPLFLAADRGPLEGAYKSLTSGTAIIREIWPDSHDRHWGGKQQLSPMLLAVCECMCVCVCVSTV